MSISDRSDKSDKDLQQKQFEYEGIKTITQEMFDQLMRYGVKQIEFDTPDKNVSLDQLRDSRARFMKKKPVEYQELLNKYITKLLEKRFQETNKIVTEKDQEIRQLEESRRSEQIQKQALRDKIKSLNEKASGLKEWALVDMLVDELNRPRESAWIRTTQAMFIELKERFNKISALKMSDHLKEKDFVLQLMKICEFSQEQIDKVANYVTNLEAKVKNSSEQIILLRKTSQQQHISIAQKESTVEEHRRNLQERQIQFKGQEKRLQQYKEATTKEVQEIRKNLQELQCQLAQQICQKDQWKKLGDKWNHIKDIMSNDSDSLNQRLKKLQSHFKLGENDEDIDRLAEMWVRNEHTDAYSKELQRLIFNKLNKQKFELMQQSGLLKQFQAKADRLQTIVQQTIKLSIQTFKQIQQLIIQKLFGNRLAPIKQTTILFELDNVVEVLTKQYKCRLARISDKLKLVRQKNDRKIVEYTMNKKFDV